MRVTWLACRNAGAALAAVAASAVLLVMSEPARAEKGKVTVEKVAFKGWKNNLRLSNGDAELIITLDVGPRVISYRLADGKNVFKEYADQVGKNGEKDWMIRGGHRLWVGPEDLTRTYALDNGPVEYEQGGQGYVWLTAGPVKEYGFQKWMGVRLADRGSEVTVKHQIRNTGNKPTELAVWAISVMAPGGVEIIPLPPKRPHPGSPKNAKSPKDYAPDLSLALWPYLDFKDPRWTFGSKYLTLRQQADRGPTKLGIGHKMGWVGYLNGGTLFVKRFDYQEGKTYPDLGSNFETFTNEDMLEIETFGPLVELAPDHTAEHTERWQLVPEVKAVHNEEEIDRNVLPKVK